MLCVEVDTGMLKLVTPQDLMRQIRGAHLIREITHFSKNIEKSRKNIDLDVVASLRSCALQCENDFEIRCL